MKDQGANRECMNKYDTSDGEIYAVKSMIGLKQVVQHEAQ